MRTTKLGLAMGFGLLLLGAGAASAFTNTVASGTPGIKGSYHDLSRESWNTSRHTLCGVCHSMHDTDVNKLIPLWKHQTSVAKDTFTLYTSPTLDATMNQPSGVTLACLSCHDGVTAVNSYGGTTNGTAVFITGGPMIGTDLSHNHPVSFDYDVAQARDPYLRPSTGSAYPTNNITAPEASFTGLTLNKAMLGNNARMECSSCHDIHRQRGGSYKSGIYTVQSSAYGDLCLMCHIK
jgi:hypothetical protein